ncbi:uncharacterized protein LOC132048957 [Lycium ferocissimum]|uniref:uncharacterized protein LOC132048957 n=1 Tax=Lycium ferocissimum TaxID=112874 RepID=UPI0028167F20|nr:uncharacterized protein LOC132048957 [Lycium ferocissimum]
MNQDGGGLFFLYGHGGTGKTFMWKTLSSRVRSKGDIVINVASSGSPLAKLIVKAKLVIWDEAPMMHRYCFEALDRTLRDILRLKDPSNLDRPFELTKNMRLQGSLSKCDLDDLKRFSDWILAIGDGKIGCSIDGIEKIEIPDDLLMHNCDDPVSGIVESTYSDYLIHSTDIKYLQERAILAPTLEMVESLK